MCPGDLLCAGASLTLGTLGEQWSERSSMCHHGRQAPAGHSPEYPADCRQSMGYEKGKKGLECSFLSLAPTSTKDEQVRDGKDSVQTVTEM